MPEKQLWIKPSAQADIEDAYMWYEANRENLGSEFLLSLDAAFQAIQSNPEFAGFTFDIIRSAALSRFPFSVYYLVESHQIVVIGVLHHSRNPNELGDRAAY